MTANPEQSIKRLRERIDDVEEMDEDDELERRWMESAGEVAEIEDLSLDKILEAKDAVDDNAALRQLLLGD